MINKPIQVEIVEENRDGIKVKLPFLDVPVEMNWTFFNKRMESGYFKLSTQAKKDILGLSFFPPLGKNVK